MFQPEIETQSPEERSGLQRERLASLVRRLRRVETPYWREKLRGVGDEPVLEELPFTRKSELRDTVPFGMLAVPLEQTVRVHASSGTHGKPTIVAYSMRDVELFAEVNARAIVCAGGSAGDVLHVAYGYGLFTGGLGLHYGGERLGATVVPAASMRGRPNRGKALVSANHVIAEIASSSRVSTSSARARATPVSGAGR